jgi:hypothetical protein
MFRKLASAAILSALVCTAVFAGEAKAPVYCGSVTCFHFRTAAHGQEPDARANQAMDIINKYLGGKVGKVTTKPAGKNVKLLLNGEVVATLTPADAAAEKQKSVAALAQKWTKVLSKAFDESKARI